MVLIAGYASFFHVPDLSGDIVLPGAFRKSLSERPLKQIKMLLHHDPERLIGFWHGIQEDRYGLQIKGHLMTGVQYVDDLIPFLVGGVLDGLSIGFRAFKTKRGGSKGQYRYLEQIDLWEISLVTFPMLPKARVAYVER